MSIPIKMEALLEEQKACIIELKTHQDNFSKASYERRANQNYIKNRLSELDDWWHDFENRDTNIRKMASEEEKSAQPYFHANTFDETQRVFIIHRKKVENYLLPNVTNTTIASHSQERPSISPALTALNSLNNDQNSLLNASESNSGNNDQTGDDEHVGNGLHTEQRGSTSNLSLENANGNPIPNNRKIVEFESLWSDQDVQFEGFTPLKNQVDELKQTYKMIDSLGEKAYKAKKTQLTNSQIEPDITLMVEGSRYTFSNDDLFQVVRLIQLKHCISVAFTHNQLHIQYYCLKELSKLEIEILKQQYTS